MWRRNQIVEGIGVTCFHVLAVMVAFGHATCCCMSELLFTVKVVKESSVCFLHRFTSQFPWFLFFLERILNLFTSKTFVQPNAIYKLKGKAYMERREEKLKTSSASKPHLHGLLMFTTHFPSQGRDSISNQFIQKYDESSMRLRGLSQSASVSFMP